MGQRLVVNINRGGKTIAAIYYHWSAYTDSALGCVWYLYDKCLNAANSYTDSELKYRLTKAIEANGGGIDGGVSSADYELMKTIFPLEEFNQYPHRSMGLIAFSNESIEEMVSWAEGMIDIDLDENLVVNDVFWYYENFNDLAESMEIDPNNHVMIGDYVGYDIGTFYLKDIESVYNAVSKSRTEYLWADNSKTGIIQMV